MNFSHEWYKQKKKWLLFMDMVVVKEVNMLTRSVCEVSQNDQPGKGSIN